MFHYERSTFFRRYGTLFSTLFISLLWFFIEAKYMNIPDVDLMPLEVINQAYSTQFQTKEAFRAALSTIIIQKIPWDSSGISIFLPSLSAFIISSRFSSREAEIIVSRGHTKAVLFLHFSALFYFIVLLMHGFTLLLHISRAGAIGFQTLNWHAFLRVWIVRSIFISSWLSPSVLFAFILKKPFSTLGLSYIYLLFSNKIVSLKHLQPLSPLSYLVQRDIWIVPYDIHVTTQGLIVSLSFFIVVMVLTILIFTQRDIAA